MREVKFIKPYGFAEDGIRATIFEAGQTVLVSGSCADSAIQQGAAEELDQRSVSSAPENKAKGRPMNKARG